MPPSTNSRLSLNSSFVKFCSGTGIAGWIILKDKMVIISMIVCTVLCQTNTFFYRDMKKVFIIAL